MANRHSANLSGVSSPHLGPETRFLLLSGLQVCWCGARSLRRGWVCRLHLLLTLSSAIILGSKSHSVLPQPVGPGPHIYSKTCSKWNRKGLNVFHIGQVSTLYKINNTGSSGRDYRICSRWASFHFLHVPPWTSFTVYRWHSYISTHWVRFSPHQLLWLSGQQWWRNFLNPPPHRLLTNLALII
jgi:hypothetical protein